MDIPYEYCACKFLELWLRVEKTLHIALSGTPSAFQIRDALKYYRVSRNFKGLSDEVAEKIFAELLKASSECKVSYSYKVVSLASSFKDCFGQFNVSAASKLLWLRNRSPYLIYDSRAATALHRLGNRFNQADYVSYCATWLREYKKRDDKLSLAAHGLINLPREYTAAFTLTDDELIELVHSTWFIERVFDIYLWEIGIVKRNGS